MIDLTGLLFWLLIFSPIIVGWFTPEPPAEPQRGSKKQRRPPVAERFMFAEEDDD